MTIAPVIENSDLKIITHACPGCGKEIFFDIWEAEHCNHCNYFGDFDECADSDDEIYLISEFENEPDDSI